MTEIETTADRFGLSGPPRRSRGLANLARKKPAAQEQEAAPFTLETIPGSSAETGPDPTTLTEAERADLTTCQAVLQQHHASFWLTGKALETISKRRLYRADHPTFEAFLEDWDITPADAYRMMNGWPLANRLLRDVPKLTRSHVEALLPVVNRYGVEAAATLHALLRDSLPKVTAAAIAQVVRELPGPDGEDDPAQQIHRQAQRVLTASADDPAEEEEGGKGTAAPVDAHLRQAVKRRALQLAEDLKRSRLSTRELNRALAEAFADPEDDRVYRAVRRWMKDREKVKAQVTEPEG
ncbi:hypothetical protein [Streptomyces megasporus]|uniref:hypothetical protein n=1 Tax=Streptomyces megasporus TaxID=44060 RepID=UPI0004E26FB5|nr:hypothetical protein [Streptomyces megasporus]